MSASQAEPIAIIGVGCRFPGGVESPDGLWQLAAQGRQTAGPVPASRWDAARLAAMHDAELAGRAGRGCFLEGDVWAWEPEAFSVAPIEQRWVDPQFRVLMEVAWQAVEHAGVPMDRIRGSRTGAYMGTYAPDNLFREARPVEDAPNSAYLFGNFTAGAAGRVAFSMDLRGPVMVLSTHCSSGLVALDTACGALTLGECDTALAGAVLLMLAPQTHYYEAPLLLSRRGACYAFDSRADGYVRGEGAGVLVLKRLADARRDGDRVLAVIRGSAVNNDGQATRLTAPSSELQQQLFRDTVAKAGIDPGEVGLVEAHGPGTAVGDPIEYMSVDAVYGRGRGRCALGSVKTNIGHSEPVSGIAGVIKVVECLRRGQIPPNATFQEWNPAIAQSTGSRLFVPTELIPWPVDGASRLAAACSYGVTGTNAHVLMESAPVHGPRRRGRRRATEDHARVYLLSGSSTHTLTRAASRLSAWAQGAGADFVLLDVAHTLSLRRSPADHRLAVVARGHRQLAERAAAFAVGQEADGVAAGTPVLPPAHAGPVFVFTGQGSQRPGMCHGMLAKEPVFAAAVAELEPLILAEANFSLREVIVHPERLVGLERIQPALFGVQVALAAVWRSWGVEPAAVIGQSLGEVAAMVVAGGLSLADGVRVICRRSALLATISGGAMASVMLGADLAQAAIDAAGADGVTLGVLTSPGSTVVSGDRAQITTLVQRWEAAGVVARLIDVEVASHSPQVDPILGRLGEALAEVPEARPRIPFYSTVSQSPTQPGVMDGRYWVRNQREPVRFHGAVSAALAAGHRLFIECTAHPLAVRPILDTASMDGATDAVAVGSLRAGSDDQDAFLTHLGAVHCAGFDGIDFATHYGDGQLADVPVTDWHRTRHGGDEQPYQLVAPDLPGAGQHPLLGGHVADPEQAGRHLWQTPLGPRLLPWLADHQVAGTPVLPGTGFAEMMLAAGVEVFGAKRVAVFDVSVLAPLVLDPEPVVTTRLCLDGDRALVEVVSSDDDGITVHARGTVRAVPADATPPELAAVADEQSLQAWVDGDPTELHRTFREQHDVFHGPAFAAIDRIQIHAHQDLAIAALRIDDAARISAGAMLLHPALADEVVQCAVSVWLAHYTLTPGPVVVAGFDEISLYGPASHTRRAHLRIYEADDMGCMASAWLTAVDGTVVAEIRGLRVRNITPASERFAARLLHQQWVPELPPKERRRATVGTWTVFATGDASWPQEVARYLDKKTEGCALLPLPDESGDLVESSSPVTGIVLAIGDAPRDEAPADTARALVSGAAKVIRAASSTARPPRLWLVHRHSPPPLAASALRGLIRTAAYELPELRAGVLEFDPEATPYAAVLDELLDDDQPPAEIALCSDGRHVVRVLQGRSGDVPQHDRSGLPPVRPGGSYIVTGGLGGLGLLTATWLARRGAGEVVVVGRTAPDNKTRQQLDSLRAAGTDVTVLTGDIGAPGVADRAVALASENGCPLRGVIHAAGVVEDATLIRLHDDLLRRVWRGKAEGAWELHKATASEHLDFFVVYSSVASLIGSPGQAAYASANAFLDGLTAWRLAQALPATSINWGAWGEVGRGQHLAERGFLTISPDDGINALERILATGHQQVGYSPLDIARWTKPYPAVRSGALLAHLLDCEDRQEEGTGLRELLLAKSDIRARREMLEQFIITCVRDQLGGTTRHIGPHTSMVVLGLDSLGAVQLQQRVQRALHTEMKPGVIWVKPSAAALTEWLLDHTGLGDRPADGTVI